jgi:hypothetical protein
MKITIDIIENTDNQIEEVKDPKDQDSGAPIEVKPEQ